MLCDFALQNTNNPPPALSTAPHPPFSFPPSLSFQLNWHPALCWQSHGSGHGASPRCHRAGSVLRQVKHPNAAGEGEVKHKRGMENSDRKETKKKKKKRKRLSRGSKKTGMEETCSALSNPTRPQLLCREFPTQAASNPTPACTKNMLNNSDFTRVLSSCTILPAPRDWCGLSGGKTTME